MITITITITITIIIITSRLKSLLSHFRFLRLFENWTVENFLEGGGMQKVLNLKIFD